MNDQELREKVKELLEVGKPFRFLVANMKSAVPDDLIIIGVTRGIQYVYLDIGMIRRFVKLLEEIEDD